MRRPSLAQAAVLIVIGSAPLQADTLWCNPDRACKGEVCKPVADEELSVRLHDRNGPHPVLRAVAQDIAITRSRDGVTDIYRGVTDDGLTRTLYVARDAMTYVFETLGPDNEPPYSTYFGACEVQP